MAGEFWVPRLSCRFHFGYAILFNAEGKEPLLPVLLAPWLSPSMMHISNNPEHVANVNQSILR